MKIVGEFLNNILFPDDIILMHRHTLSKNHNRCYKNNPMKVGKWV